MDETEVTRLRIAVSRLHQLTILQSSAIMRLSAAVLGMEGLEDKVRSDVLEVFHGCQEHIDVLAELQALGDESAE